MGSVPAPTSRLVTAAAIVLPALVVTAVALVGTTFAAVHQSDARSLDGFGDALLVASGLALLGRRRHPSVVLVATVLLVVGYLAVGYPFGPIFLAPLVALCTAVLAGRRRAAYATTALAVVALIGVHAWRNAGAVPLAGVAGWVAALAAVIAAAEGWRARRGRLAQEAAARHEATLRRRGDERLRIAQELHDVLGHHVSLINVQAGVALYLMDDDPEQARTALTAIKATSRDLLRDMRASLGVLRGVDGDAAHHPVPGLADLDRLLDDVRAAGLPVQLQVRGTAADLAPQVDRAAYRIVQEALTNVRRHAGDPAAATVLLAYADDGLTVQIDDDGHGWTSGGARPGAGSADRGAPPPAPVGEAGADSGRHDRGGVDDRSNGSGLTGMAERARAVGGSSDIGPRQGGGFRVRAHLPVPTEERT